MIPYLETTVNIPGNDQNAELWRILGLLYLNERDTKKAFAAWKIALDLDPSLATKYEGLQIVYMYDSMKQFGEPVVNFVDFATGNFNVRFST
jgi:cytochrome c-type biogenesis protein CcmH/NrfG